MAEPQPMQEGETAFVNKRTWPISDVYEVDLKNGMKVCLKSTNFLDDQIVMRCVARGGLSEISQTEYKDALFAGTVSRELGVFGFRPEVFSDAMAGKRVDVNPNIGTYKRSITGETSPDHLDTLLQCVHLVFSTNVEDQCNEDDLDVLRKMQIEAVKNARRNPMQVFSEIQQYLTYGKSYLSKPITLKTLQKMSPENACRYFNKCFLDPSHFTMVLVGAFDREAVLPLLEKYISSIPRPLDSSPKITNVKPAPFEFPKKAVSKRVRLKMVEHQGAASITFPVTIVHPDAIAKQEALKRGETYKGPTLEGFQALTRAKFLTMISAAVIERRLLARLRFERGEIYSCSCSASFGYSDPNPSNGEPYRGDLSVVFSCDPRSGETLSKVALDEIEKLQKEGPSLEDVNTAKEVEIRSLEEHRQENIFWRDYVDAMYASQLLPVLDMNIDKVYENTEAIRSNVLETLSPEIMRAHLQETVAIKRRVKVVLLPQRPLLVRLLAPNVDDVKGFLFERPDSVADLCGRLALVGCFGTACYFFTRSTNKSSDEQKQQQ